MSRIVPTATRKPRVTRALIVVFTTVSALLGLPVGAWAVGGTVSLQLQSTILGERAHASGSLSKGIARPINVQYLKGDRWREVASTTSARTGSWSATTDSPAAAGSYRAVAPSIVRNGVRYSRIVSPRRTLPIVEQQGVLAGSSSVASEATYTLTATLTP